MNKRLYPRTELILPLTLTCKEAEIVGETQDISINGLFARVDKELKLNSSVGISIQAGDDPAEIIECCGKVVRRADYGVGIRIETMELQSYIKWRYIVTQARPYMDEIEPEIPTFVVQ